MPQTISSPSTVPSDPDGTAYLVIDRFVGVDVYPETEVGRTDRETVIADLLAAQFNGIMAQTPPGGRREPGRF